MSELATTQADIMERVIVVGDLSKLHPQERVRYYAAVCESVGLNPLTRPFDYINLNGKLTLYAKKDATDQLRRIHNIAVRVTSRETHEGVYIVTAAAKMPNGREDEDVGAVNVGGLKGDAYANAVMKATTKAKRRVTLSICGLGMLDETEIETIPNARPWAEPQHQPLPPPADAHDPPPDEPQQPAEPPATPEQVQQIMGLIADMGSAGPSFQKAVFDKHGITSWTTAPGTTVAAAIAHLLTFKKPSERPAATVDRRAEAIAALVDDVRGYALEQDAAGEAVDKWLRRIGMSKTPDKVPPAKWKALIDAIGEGRFKADTGTIEEAQAEVAQ